MKAVLLVLLSAVVLTMGVPAAPKQTVIPKKLKARPANMTLKISTAHIIDTPKICPEGQKMDSAGNCKVVWSKRSVPEGPRPACIIDCDIPDRPCPEGQKPDANGNCRDEWGMRRVKREEAEDEMKPACIIDCDIPDRPCPEGQKPDANGVCRDEWGMRRAKREEAEDHVKPLCVIGCNIPSRPCPEGQKPDANGNCRDEWFLKQVVKRSADNENAMMFRRLFTLPPKAPSAGFGFTKGSRPDFKPPKVPDLKPCPPGLQFNAEGECIDTSGFLAKPRKPKSPKRDLASKEKLCVATSEEDESAEAEPKETFGSLESEEAADLETAKLVANVLDMKQEKIAQLKETFGPAAVSKMQRMMKDYLESWLANEENLSS